MGKRKTKSSLIVVILQPTFINLKSSVIQSIR